MPPPQVPISVSDGHFLQAPTRRLGRSRGHNVYTFYLDSSGLFRKMAEGTDATEEQVPTEVTVSTFTLDKRNKCDVIDSLSLP